MFESYTGFALLGAWVAIALGWAVWPWLRQRATRDKAWTLVVATTLLLLALYLQLGSPFAIAGIRAEQREHQATAAHIMRLEAIAPQSRSAEDWAALGAAYMLTEEYHKAEDALREAVVVSEGAPELIMAYGKAQMLAADGEITDGAVKAFTLAAQLMPDNPEPEFLLAVARMQAGDKAGAREHLAALLPKLPSNAPLRHVIKARLQEMDGASPTP